MGNSDLFPDEEKKLTPDQVRQMRPPESIGVIETVEEYRASKSLFEHLVTPMARATILEILVSRADEACTVAEICEETDRVSKATFARHKDPLLEFGVIEKAGKKGNAQTYRANVYHPAVQLITMLRWVLVHGHTRMFLDERFVSTSTASTDSTPDGRQDDHDE